VIGQRRIDERPLPVEPFHSAATREAVSVKASLDDFRERGPRPFVAGACDANSVDLFQMARRSRAACFAKNGSRADGVYART
jgi:hypothetical protein